MSNDPNGEFPKRMTRMVHDGLTHAELIVACKNIGFDLTCDACATLFYTGASEGTPGMPYEHTCHAYKSVTSGRTSSAHPNPASPPRADDADLEDVPAKQVDAEIERAIDEEAGRWQRRIADVIRAVGLEPIDASGNESNDPLDWTAVQVAAALREALDEDVPMYTNPHKHGEGR